MVWMYLLLKKETKLPNIPTKAERKMSKKLDIETRKKIVGDGVKKSWI